MESLPGEASGDEPRARRLPAAVIVLTATVLLAVDQLTKWLVVTHLSRGEFLRVAPFLKLRLAHNTGVAFGLWSEGGRILPVVAALCIVGLLVWGVRQTRHSALVGWALALVVGGALGNIVDRLRLGHVVDFIDFPFWPTFNFADMCVVSGALLLLTYGLFLHEAPRRAAAPESEARENG